MKEEFNIRLITLDSCRYDVAQEANIPTLSSISELRKAETQSTYTFPAHNSFFIGNLPRIEGDNQSYFDEIGQIWRSESARETQKKVLFVYDGKNIIDFHRRNKFNVWGYGGVGFFNPDVPSNSLTDPFMENFRYFGPQGNLHPHQKVPRRAETFPLGNIDQIANDLSGNRPYFLFMNCPETHMPYDVPGTITDDDYFDLIKRVYHEQNTKYLHDPNEVPFTQEELGTLKNLQIEALEWIDVQLATLFASLPDNFPTLTIVMGDHGEEFGDEGRFGHAHVAKTVNMVPLWAFYEE